MDALAFLVFLIVIWILQGIGKLVEFIAAQQRLAQEERESQQQGGATAETQPRAEPRAEPQTPFEALMRYMEDQARGKQPPPPPAPEPPPPVYVAPAPTPARSTRGELSQRHLHSVVGDRHSGTGVGDRHMGGLSGLAQLTGFRGADDIAQTSFEAIDTLPPWQKAIIYSELLGPPRSQEPWRVKKL